MASFFYSDTGEGLPVVFLHGYCETSDIWSDLQQKLYRDFRIISIDLPGFGGSDLPEYTFSLKDIAREIKLFLDSIGVKEYILIGHSLGGYIALSFAMQFDENLLGLGLFHSSVFADDEEKKENRTKLMHYIGKNGVKTFIRTFIPSLFYKDNLDTQADVIRSLKKSAESTSPESVIEYARAMRDREGSEDVLAKFSKPVMFIIGEEDASVTLEKSMYQVTMPKNSHFLRLAKTGHMGMFERRDQTAQFIKGFLDFCKHNH